MQCDATAETSLGVLNILITTIIINIIIILFLVWLLESCLESF